MNARIQGLGDKLQGGQQRLVEMQKHVDHMKALVERDKRQREVDASRVKELEQKCATLTAAATFDQQR